MNKLVLELFDEQQHGKKITYTYDSMNRQVARTDENGTTQYLYGNPNHPFQLTAVHSPSGSLSRYHYDDFGLLFALERDNNWYYITTDQLGTPRVVCDANGELVKVLEYDSFGQIIADSNWEFELHISFAGGLIDVDTELVRFGFRDYDAVAGKWTAKDPMGFAAQNGNLYQYVDNNTINYKDPLGLYPNWLINVSSAIINPFASLASGFAPWCGIGPNRDATDPPEGACTMPKNAQDQACINHDFALKGLGKAFWQVLNADVSQAHWELAKESTAPLMKFLFTLLSLPGLPARLLNP
ncbi:RHS repeat-associated core domain-containing protein [Microcoleus sp. CAWBG640]|uniref:RHS repeat domain-containing protein n=1 Tax=Microcoleus sp. CAWBG640 TaxID=2841653 RepID=UPI00312B49DB